MSKEDISAEYERRRSPEYLSQLKEKVGEEVFETVIAHAAERRSKIKEVRIKSIARLVELLKGPVQEEMERCSELSLSEIKVTLPSKCSWSISHSSLSLAANAILIKRNSCKAKGSLRRLKKRSLLVLWPRSVWLRGVSQLSNIRDHRSSVTL